MVAKPFTPVSPTGGRNSCRHSGFQVLCSCRGYVIFHNQPEGSQVLASSLSSGLLNVSGSFTEGWHQEAHGSGCCVWYRWMIKSAIHLSYWTVDVRLPGSACRAAVFPDFCIPGSSSPHLWNGLQWIHLLFGTIFLPQGPLNSPHSSLLELWALNHTVKQSTHPVYFQSVPLISQHARKLFGDAAVLHHNWRQIGYVNKDSLSAICHHLLDIHNWCYVKQSRYYISVEMTGYDLITPKEFRCVVHKWEFF